MDELSEKMADASDQIKPGMPSSHIEAIVSRHNEAADALAAIEAYVAEPLNR